MGHALVLNATYEPLCVVPARRALLLVVMSKAVAVEDSEQVLHSATLALPAPAVVRLMRYVRLPHRGPVPLSRRAVFVRDGGRCVYCGVTATSIDHVLPRSRGGRHEWANVVSACRRCNHLKADRTVAEIGWRLRPPQEPKGSAWRVLGTGRSDPSWAPYLAAYGGDAAAGSVSA